MKSLFLMALNFCAFDHCYNQAHDNKNNNTRDTDVFAKYSPEGGIPALVIGCKFYRVGTAEPETAEGTTQAEKDFTSLICQVTNNLPAEICNQQ